MSGDALSHSTAHYLRCDSQYSRDGRTRYQIRADYPARENMSREWVVVRAYVRGEKNTADPKSLALDVSK